jgi:glycosyltransferase involved in cell wall biosynthesis
MTNVDVSKIIRNPDITVIIPCYNSARFLSVAVKSACLQGGVSVEVIAVDDGSKDATLRVLEKLGEKFPNLRVISEKLNRGQSAARNRGIRAARGKWISFLDSDDFFESNLSLSRALGSLEDNDAKVIHVGALTLLGHLKVYRCHETLDEEAATTTSLWQLIIERHHMKKFGLKFDEDLPQREDFPFVLRVLGSTRAIMMHSAVTIVHVARSGSIMQQAVTGEQIALRVKHMEKVKDAALGYPPNSPIKRALARKYLEAALRYWAGPLADVISAGGSENLELAGKYLAALHLVSDFRGPLCQTGTELGGKKAASILDILRLVAESERLDFFWLLTEGKTLTYSQLITLSEHSRFEWAEIAILWYLRYRSDNLPDYLPPHSVSSPFIDRKVVLHIGYPKTGTSALQNWMEENRLLLLRQGIWYPVVGSSWGDGLRENRTAGHSTLLRLLSKKTTKNQILRAISSEIESLGSHVHTVFISSESVLSPHLWKNKNGRFRRHLLEKIQQNLGSAQIDVLVVARSPLAWAKKYYKEIVSNPFNRYAPSFLEFVRLLKKRGLTDLESLKSFLNTTFFPGTIWLSSYSEVLKEGGIVEWVARRVQIQREKCAQPQNFEINQAGSDAQAFVLREVKKYQTKSAEISEFLLQVMESADLRDSDYSLISAEESAQAEELLAEEISGYRRAFPADIAPLMDDEGRKTEPVFLPLEKLRARRLRPSFSFTSLALTRNLGTIQRATELIMRHSLSLLRIRLSRRKYLRLRQGVLFISFWLTNQHAKSQIERGFWAFSSRGK